MLQAVRRGLDAVIVCPTGVVGPYDFNRSEMGQTLLGFARRKLQLLVDGAYDFVDVRDVARSMIQAGRRGRTGEIYILPGTQVQLVNLLRTVEKITGRHTPRWVVPITLAKAMAKLAEPFYRLTSMTPQFTSYSLQTVRDNSQIDGGKARRELGHDPRPLYETVADTLRWLMRPQQAAVLPL